MQLGSLGERYKVPQRGPGWHLVAAILLIFPRVIVISIFNPIQSNMRLIKKLTERNLTIKNDEY